MSTQSVLVRVGRLRTNFAIMTVMMHNTAKTTVLLMFSLNIIRSRRGTTETHWKHNYLKRHNLKGLRTEQQFQNPTCLDTTIMDIKIDRRSRGKITEKKIKRNRQTRMHLKANFSCKDQNKLHESMSGKSLHVVDLFVES